MKRNVYISCLLALIFAISLLASLTRSVDAFQFVDRILRPCGGTSTGIVIVTTTDINLNPCPGGAVKINGTPITPGAGLPDPGSNGFVVRTALNTDVARTLTVTPPITITNGTGVSANPLIACPTCVTASAVLTSTALMTGAGLQAAQTPSTTATLAANGDITTPGTLTTGNAGGTSGAIDLFGATSGTVTTTVKSAAGTWTLTLPDNDGTPGQFLQTDGSGIASWQTVSGFACSACGANIVQKGDGAGNFANSRIVDDGTDILVPFTAGAFKVGDYAIASDGTFFTLDTTGKQIFLGVGQAGNDFGQLVLDYNTGTGANAELSGSTSAGASVGLSVVGNSQLIRLNANTVRPQTNGTTDLGTTTEGYKQLFIDAAITAGGTTGNQTINKSAGSVNFAAAATSLTVTSNKVTANSVVMCTVATNDTTLKSVQCVPTAGSFTIFANAAAAAETRVNFWVLNQ